MNMESAHYLDDCLSQSFYISYADWSWWEYNPWLFIRSKVKITWFTFVVNFFKQFLLKTS